MKKRKTRQNFEDEGEDELVEPFAEPKTSSQDLNAFVEDQQIKIDESIPSNDGHRFIEQSDLNDLALVSNQIVSSLPPPIIDEKVDEPLLMEYNSEKAARKLDLSVIEESDSKYFF